MARTTLSHPPVDRARVEREGAVMKGQLKYRLFGLAVILVAFQMVPSPARASVFDDCVLNHMAGVTSDFAAKSIKEACVRDSEQTLPEAALVPLLEHSQMLFSWVGDSVASNQLGLVVQFNNESLYEYTEILISVTDLKT